MMTFNVRLSSLVELGEFGAVEGGLEIDRLCIKLKRLSSDWIELNFCLPFAGVGKKKMDFRFPSNLLLGLA